MSANEPFDPLLWHDNALHAFRIEAGADGMGELVLDIDHIVEWLPPRPGHDHLPLSRGAGGAALSRSL